MRLEHWFYTAPLRLRSLFRRQQVEAELDEELRYHREQQIEEGIAKGLSPEEARYAAMRAMDGLEQRKRRVPRCSAGGQYSKLLSGSSLRPADAEEESRLHRRGGPTLALEIGANCGPLSRAGPHR
jgi:hypothetical protein